MLGAGCKKDNTGVHGGREDTKEETERERGTWSWRKICGGRGKQDARRHLKKIREKRERGIKMGEEETAVSEERRMKLKEMEKIKIEERD